MPRSAFSKRGNASSGGLHPVEAYVWVLARDFPEMANRFDGDLSDTLLFHYSCKTHCLELRHATSSNMPQPAVDLRRTGVAALFLRGTFLIGLSAVYWREVWKYGERGLRYSLLDIGHAVAAVDMAAARLGWRVVRLEGLADVSMATLLGLATPLPLANGEAEYPALWAAVVTDPAALDGSASGPPIWQWPHFAIDAMAIDQWHGVPNVLSVEHASWPLVDNAAEALRVPRPENVDVDTLRGIVGPLPQHHWPSVEEAKGLYGERTVGAVIRQRRSALAFDSKQQISVNQFYAMLSRAAAVPLGDCGATQPIHFALWVSRVDGLPTGRYFLIRNEWASEVAVAAVRACCAAELRPVEELDPLLPATLRGRLFLLCTQSDSDSRSIAEEASQASCSQKIALEGAFVIAMVARLADALHSGGGPEYRRLHIAAGAVGQWLYVEAEALGLRATGMGCFLDDVSRDAFGFISGSLVPLYHFTCGHYVTDNRYPPYNYQAPMVPL